MFWFRGPEDRWMCVDGEWVKHGAPSSPKPSEGCGENNQNQKEITNFEECVLAGNLVMESYPRQCRTADNKTFVEDIGNELEKSDLIMIANPRPNQLVASPLVVQGEARGYWFFEASFPIKLFDADGNLIAQTIAQAQSDWMVEDFVGFTAELEFANPGTKTGNLILQKDNPSGLPEYEDELRVPIIFSYE